MSTLQRVAKKLPDLEEDELRAIEAHIDGIRIRKRVTEDLYTCPEHGKECSGAD